jgi:phenylacetate-CoA ligase
LWGMSGWRLGQRNIHVWGNETSIQRWRSWGSRAKNTLLKQRNIPSTIMNDPDLLDVAANEIIAYDPLSIDGYPGAIYSLAQHFKVKGYRLRNLKQVLTTAENLENYQRELIESVFAPTGDLYGSGEVLGIATRPITDDKYYILEPHVIVEAIATGMPGMKDVVVTDLDNQGMPLIRYRIGDMVDDLKSPDKDARLPLAYFYRLMGRSSDIILLPNGKRFHPVNIFGGTLFRKFPAIARHKVVWNGVALKFVFERSSPLNEKQLQIELECLMAGFDVPFSVEYTYKMPLQPSGKHTYLEIIEGGKRN